jgi:hypothetical protein
MTRNVPPATGTQGGNRMTTIDRRTLIRGATVVGGMVWALPVIETIGMPAAAAGSAPPGGVLPGSLGGSFTPAIGGLVQWDCNHYVLNPCTSIVPADLSGACPHVTALTTSTSVSVTLAVALGFHAVVAQSLVGSTPLCLPAVQTPTLGIGFSEQWTFTGNGEPFAAEIVIVPTA